MKTKLHKKLVLCLLMLLSVSYFNYAQSFIVNDDFETDALGTLPDGWVIRFNGTGDANQKIVGAPIKNGNHAFQVSGSGWSASLNKSVAEMPNEATFEGWMRAEDVVTGGRSGVAFVNASAGTWGTFLARLEFYNGNIITYHFEGYSQVFGTQYVLQPATSNTWYHFKIEANISAGTYKVFINGIQASSSMDGTTIKEFPFLKTVAPSSIELYGNSVIYFDDVKLYNTKNLVAYYPFNGNSNDESGNGNHGTEEGATLTADRFGNPDSAYSFDGVNDVITIPQVYALNMENNLSISVWVKPNIEQNAMVLGKSNYSTATNYLIRTTNSNFIEYAHKTRNFSDNNPLNIGQWNHIAVVSHSTGEREIYINNSLSTFASQPDAYGIVTNAISIGAAYYFGSYFAEFFNGSIDDIRIYNTALSASEVSNLYNFNSLSIADSPLFQNTGFYIYNKSLHFNDTQNLSEIKSITVYNLLAQKVYALNKFQKENILPLKQGIYILKLVYKNNKISTKKIVIP